MSQHASELEVESWANQPLSAAETADLTADTLAMVYYLGLAADIDNDSVDYYKARAETLDDNGNPTSIISLNAFSVPVVKDLRVEAVVPFVVRIHLDEKLLALSGYAKAAALYRRTFIGINPALIEPMRIVRSHELRRRSEHRFAKPKNHEERALLKERFNFSRTRPTYADGILLSSLIDVLERTDEKAEDVWGFRAIDEDDN